VDYVDSIGAGINGDIGDGDNNGDIDGVYCISGYSVVVEFVKYIVMNGNVLSGNDVVDCGFTVCTGEFDGDVDGNGGNILVMVIVFLQRCLRTTVDSINSNK
jgi:hypothetical protein